MKKKCKYCNKEFVLNSSHQLYCSLSCCKDNLRKRRHKHKSRSKLKRKIEARKRYLTHKNKILKYSSEYQKGKGKDIHKKAMTNYNRTENGREVNVLKSRKYKAKKKELIHDFTKEEWKNKLKSTFGICPKCKKFVGISKLELDHTPAISKAFAGFVYKINNVNPLCRSCNAKKHNK